MNDTVSLVGDRMSDAGDALRVGWRAPDVRRSLQLALAVIWLLDGVLQLQPFMFTNQFGSMIGGMAAGNPHVVAHTIAWNAGIVGHHAVATDAAFALIQVLLGLGIAWRPSLKVALAASIVWSLGVWWFGEGLGGVLGGNASPIAGGPGAVLIYALLAVLLWPTDRTSSTSAPFTAARAVGVDAAKAIWAVVWGLLAFLALFGHARASQSVHTLLSGLAGGEPKWLAAIDTHGAKLFAHRGLETAIVVAVLCLAIAAGVYLPTRAARLTVVLAIVVAAVIWVVGENFGALFGGGSATDPNSGALLILLAACYWPLHPKPTTATVQDVTLREQVV